MDKQVTERVIENLVETIATAAAVLTASGYEELASDLVEASRQFAQHLEGVRGELQEMLNRLQGTQ